MKKTPASNIDEPEIYTGESAIQSAHSTWKSVQRDLAHALGQNVHRSWTGRLQIAEADAYTVTFTAPTRFTATKIENSYSDPLRRLWKKHDGVSPPRRVVIAGPSSTRRVTPSKPVQTAPAQMMSSTYASGEVTQARPNIIEAVTGSSAPSPRSRFTFDNFVVGKSNEFAYAVARQVASSDTVVYNPVIIHGENGMGKTHLLYAIKHAIADTMPQKKIRVISGEGFVNAFVGSVRAGGREAIDAFKASLRQADVLLIDDAHFIASKPGSQEELLHTLISLVDDGRQVVLAADRKPDDIDAASDRLRSYLNSGLVCKVGAADYNLRLQMLDRLISRRRADNHPALTIPQSVRDHLAARVNTTPRDLEGAFNQVIAQSEYLGTPITLESVQSTLSESRYGKSNRITIERIQKTVASTFGISMTDMLSKRRARVVARPRQVAMYLCKKLTQQSLPNIGRHFGGRDHTTVIHAVKRITDLRAEDLDIDTKIKAIEYELTGQKG